MKKYITIITFCIILPKLCLAQNPAVQYIPSNDHNFISNRGHYKVGSTYTINNEKYTPTYVDNHVEYGYASWYGEDWDNKPTANGEVFLSTDISAAHRTLPIPSIVQVTNLENGKTAIVKINDRGPFVETDKRIIDVSVYVAKMLGFFNQGLVKVKIELLPQETQEFRLLMSTRNKHYKLFANYSKKTTTAQTVAQATPKKNIFKSYIANKHSKPHTITAVNTQSITAKKSSHFSKYSKSTIQ